LCAWDSKPGGLFVGYTIIFMDYGYVAAGVGAAVNCVFADDPTHYDGWLSADLAGHPRVNGAVVDLGCYAYGSPRIGFDIMIR
jgi:hypothetical protein